MLDLPSSALVGDVPKASLVPINGFPEGLEEGLCIDRTGNDPGVELGLRVPGIGLAEVQQKLESVVADLEVVGVAAFGPAGILKLLLVMPH